MKELTFEEFCSLRFQYRTGISFDWGVLRAYVNDKYGLRVEICTKRKRKGDIYSGWRKQQITYFLSGDERQFETSDQLYVAYMEKACGIKTTD